MSSVQLVWVSQRAPAASRDHSAPAASREHLGRSRMEVEVGLEPRPSQTGCRGPVRTELLCHMHAPRISFPNSTKEYSGASLNVLIV